MDTYLETERLMLRHVTLEDADLLIELNSDPEVMRYLPPGEAERPAAEMRELVMPAIVAEYRRWQGEFGLFAVHEKDGGAFIGWFSLWPESEGPREDAELGYRLRKAAWGRGYATEGSLALLHKGFTELGMRSVWAETLAVNSRSRRVMEKAGLTLTGEIPVPEDMQVIDGADQGGVRYGITREQWQQR
ncbi:GNAT family N-acetyltransferase [Streptomyces cyaneofuscatus]|uniref:GNAT family N-acetyltransferase n=1 Tax=Streptomyces cyaneofuscatus TaxID=66883 RepID=UPI003829B267